MVETAETYNIELDLSRATSEVKAPCPERWIVYKHGPASYTLFLNFMYVCVQPAYFNTLPHYKIISDDDNIRKTVTGDTCELLTDKYRYVFRCSERSMQIENRIGGIYRASLIELQSIQKLTEAELAGKPEHYLQLDEGTTILSYYYNNSYRWSKIISDRYTAGVYFILLDRIFAVMRNGSGQIDIFNFDGSHCGVFAPGSIEYIERYWIDGEFLYLYGFIWNPHYLTVKVKISSIFSSQLERRIKWEDDEDDEDEDF
jgi:hypothetical protein